MQRLLEDAEKLSGIEYDISSYADIVDAIHVVQTEMGITGTTAKEASTTIQGSVASAKSAWENLVAGIGNENADLDQLITNFVDSVGTAGENIIPRVEQILIGMGSAIQKLAPIIGEQLPPLIQSVLPSLLSAGGELLGGLANGIIAAAPALIETGIPMVASLVSGLSAALPNAASSAMEIVTTLAGGISEQLPALVPVAVDAVLQLADTLTDPDGLSNMVDSALQLITSLADGLIEALPKLIEKAPVIVQNLVTAIIENAPKLAVAALTLIVKLALGIAENLGKILEKGKELVESLISGVGEKFSDLLRIGRDIADKVGEGIRSLAGAALQWGKDLIDNFIQGIMGAVGRVKDAVSSVAGAVKDFLGFSEPEKGPLSNFHTYAPDMMKLFAQGITDNAGLIEDSFNKALDFKRDMNFGTARVGFESSVMGAPVAAAVNAISDMVSSINDRPTTYQLVTPDGKVLAEYVADPLVDHMNANGTPIVNPIS